MAKPVYVPQLGRVIQFSDDASDAQIVAEIKSMIPAGPAAAAAPAGPDESTLLGRAAYGFATGITEIPGGIAALVMPAEQAAASSLGQISEQSRKYLQETFGIDPTKDPTAAQQAAEALGSVGSFLIPATGVAKVASLAGRGARAAGALGEIAAAEKAARLATRAGTATAAAQGVALGAGQRAETIRGQLASGMEISPETQLASQQLSGLIGASEALPLERFFGPLTQLLSKVPASKAPVVEKIVKSRLAKITKAGLAEGAQEAASGIANDLMEYGVYNPDVQIGQDLLSSAGTGAFAGSFVEGLVQLAAGRRLRPYRQLQKDLAAETQQNAIDARRGIISTAAEQLRQYNVEGPVEVIQDEVENVPIFSLKTRAGNIIGEFADRNAVTEALDIYKAKTGAKVDVIEAAEAPSIFPVRIGRQQYKSADEIKASRDRIATEIEKSKLYISTPEFTQIGATQNKVSPEEFTKQTSKRIAGLEKQLKPLDEFITGTTDSAEKQAGVRIERSTGGGATLQHPTYQSYLDAVRATGIPDSEIEAATGIKTEEDFLKAREIEMQEYVEGPAQNAVRRVYEKGGSPFSSNAFGPGRKGVDYTASDGSSQFEPLLESDVLEAPEAVSVEPVSPIGLAEEAAVEAPEAVIETPEAPSTVGSVPFMMTNKIRSDLRGRGYTEEQIFNMRPEEAQDILGRPPEAPPEQLSAGPLPEVAPTPKTVSQVTAEVTAPRDYTPEQKAFDERVFTGLKSRLSTLNLPGIEPVLREMIDKKPGYLVRGFVDAKGTPNDMKIILELSKGILDPRLTVEQNIEALTEVMNHEIIHIVRRMGLFRPAEWNILSKAVKNTKVPGKSYTYLDKAQAVYEPMGGVYTDPEAVVEEAVAEMYKDWVSGKSKPVQNATGLLNRLREFFRRIFGVLKSDAQTQVFRRIESGEVGTRDRFPSNQNLDLDGGIDNVTMFSASPTDPKNSVKAYKLFRMKNGKLYPLFVNANNEIPIGKWLVAELGELTEKGRVKSKIGELAYRPGWHAGDLPIATHIGGKSDSKLKAPDYRPDDQVWAEIEMSDDFDWQSIANERARTTKSGRLDLKTAHITDQIPRGGHYRYKTNPNMTGNWLIGGEMKVVRLLSDEEVTSINDAAGVKDLPRIKDQSKDTGRRFSAAPLPADLEAMNEKLYAPAPKKSFKDMIFDFFLSETPTDKKLKTIYGDIEIGKWTRAGLIGRAAAVDKYAMIERLEKLEQQKKTGNFERNVADYSALASLIMSDRSSHIAASMMMRGTMKIKKAQTGDILSATIDVEESPDSLLKIFEIMLQPGAIDSATGKPKDKRDIFRLYATAKRAIGLKAEGKRVPKELTDANIKKTISFTETNYPEIVEAYKMYQRFNRSLLQAAVDAELISPQAFSDLTKRMDYYSYYYEVFEEPYTPNIPSKTASRFNLRPYKGTELGGLINDPMYVMLQNVQFWTSAIAKNLASRKSFELGRRMGVTRLLGAGEAPDRALGEEDQVMFFRDKGVDRRFAVSDPLLISALGSDDRIDVGRFWQIMGLPTQLLRESITRDPGFMVANLMRDTVSAWITSGADILPFIDTAKGFANAYKNGASFQALQGRGIVGSYDLAMLGPKELAAQVRRTMMPKNVHSITSPEAMTAVGATIWNRLGALSEMSDAATRIAVYDSAIKQGFSEAEAAFRALEIMNFSRRGASQTLSILTKLVPFLNARIQGLDVLYQAGRAGIRVATGRALGEKDADLGKKFLIRGGMLAAISVALEMLNDDDEDYQQLDDYIKNSNLLIPLAEFGLKGEFIAIPKAFETGLLFSTFPQQFYKSMTGQASTRENVSLFFSSFASTFGVNPIPQFMLPALEVIVNHDFYTGLPLISEGQARLAPELQYNSRTSQLAMMISKVPVFYNFTTGKFEGASPIVIDNLISGYTGPLGTYISQAVSLGMEGVDVGPDRLPRKVSDLPVVRRFFIDSESKNPKVVSQAYELFRIVDEANRSYSRLRQIGDAEAVKDFLDENRDVLSYRKYVFRLVEGLNKLAARERQIAADQEMTREEKFEAMRKLRETRLNLASKVSEINEKIGR